MFAGLGDCVWILPLLSLGYFRSPGRPGVLAVADLLWDLPSGVVFRGTERLLIYCSDCSRSPGRTLNCWVFREVKLLSCMKMFSRGPRDSGFCFSVCSSTPGMLLVCWVSCTACHRAPVRSADCGVCCPVALCTEELLGCLQARCLQESKQVGE